MAQKEPHKFSQELPETQSTRTLDELSFEIDQFSSSDESESQLETEEHCKDDRDKLLPAKKMTAADNIKENTKRSCILTSEEATNTHATKATPTTTTLEAMRANLDRLFLEVVVIMTQESLMQVVAQPPTTKVTDPPITEGLTEFSITTKDYPY